MPYSRSIGQLVASMHRSAPNAATGASTQGRMLSTVHDGSALDAIADTFTTTFGATAARSPSADDHASRSSGARPSG